MYFYLVLDSQELIQILFISFCFKILYKKNCYIICEETKHLFDLLSLEVYAIIKTICTNQQNSQKCICFQNSYAFVKKLPNSSTFISRFAIKSVPKPSSKISLQKCENCTHVKGIKLLEMQKNLTYSSLLNSEHLSFS